MAASAPPSYPQSTGRGTGTTASSSRPAALATASRVAAPVPHFDSILRAAPAFDDDIGCDDDDSPSASSSTLSLTELKQDGEGSTGRQGLLSLMAAHAHYHISLHAYLDANVTLQQVIHGTQEQLHVDAGKVKSLSTKIDNLERRGEALRVEGDKRARVFWSPKRKREWRRRMAEIEEQSEPMKVALRASELQLHQDREKLHTLEGELIEYKKVESRLDSIDDTIFRGPTPGHSDEDELEEQYHVTVQTQRRLRWVVQMESRAQEHLAKANQLCLALIKELLAALNIGIDIGVPSNTKHKNGLWVGSSATHSAKTSRNHVLRAKTLCGDLHTNYVLARVAHRRVAVLTKLKVIELNRLPGMNAKNVVNEEGLHRSLEQSYAQAKIAKAHIDNQQRQSKGRQNSIRQRVKVIGEEARLAWLRLRSKRREIIEQNCSSTGQMQQTTGGIGQDDLPPYRRNCLSSSLVGPPLPEGDGSIALPPAFRRRVDRQSMAKSKAIVLEVTVEFGGLVDDDDDAGENEQSADVDEDPPGLELSFR